MTGGRIRGSTDTDGRFVLPIPAGNSHRLTAFEPTLGAVRQDIECDPAVDVLVPDLVLGGEGTIEGRVVLPDRTPAADVEVQAWHESTRNGLAEHALPSVAGLGRAVARSGPDGRFRLRGLIPGTYALLVTGGLEAFPSWRRDLATTGATEVVLTQTAPRVWVRIVDAEGDPVPGARWVAKYLGSISGSTSGIVQRADGLVEIWWPPWPWPGERRVRIAAQVRGTEPWTEGEVTVPEDGRDTWLTLVVGLRGEGEHLRLRLTTAEGTPVLHAGVTVATPLAGAAQFSRILASADGVYDLSPLQPGPATLTVTAGQMVRHEWPWQTWWFPEVKDVVVAAGGTTHVAMRVREGGRLEVVLHAPGGQSCPGWVSDVLLQGPVPGASLLLQEFFSLEADGRSVPGNGVAVGRRAVSRHVIEPGRYVVSAKEASCRCLPVEVTIHAGITTRVDLTLGREGEARGDR